METQGAVRFPENSDGRKNNSRRGGGTHKKRLRTRDLLRQQKWAESMLMTGLWARKKRKEQTPNEIGKKEENV